MTYQQTSLRAPVRWPAWSGATAVRVLTVALVVAGLVHLTVGQEHLLESLAIGIAMLVGAVAQLALAFGVRHGVRSPYLAFAVIALNLGFGIAWFAAITVGLPVAAHGHDAAVGLAAAHGGLSHSEPVTPLAVVTVSLELAAIAAVLRLRSSWLQPHRI